MKYYINKKTNCFERKKKYSIQEIKRKIKKKMDKRIKNKKKKINKKANNMIHYSVKSIQLVHILSRNTC